MSEIGLHGGIYEQLRVYADRLDRALIGLRNPQPEANLKARKDIGTLLHEISDRDSKNPTTQLIALILRQELPMLSGQGLTLCATLASVLEQRAPNPAELSQLEHIALAIDKECSSTLARIKGRA